MTFDQGALEAVRRELRKFTPLPVRELRRKGAAPALLSDGSGASSTGAHIHLERAATQSITAAGEAISWDTVGAIGPSGWGEFTAGTTITIPLTGYYNVDIFTVWSSFTEGGNVKVQRTRGGVTVDMWPPGNNLSFVATNGAEFTGVAPAIPCLAGDTLTVIIDPDDASAQNLASATVAVYLVDREAPALWSLVFTADNYGLGWDGSEWWTTDDTDNEATALFERDTGGTVLNSYANYDLSGDPDRCRSITFLSTFLWAVGNDELVYKINPSTGATDSTWTTGASGLSVAGIGTDGTNLFVIERDDSEIREFNEAGTLQTTDSFPAGRDLRDICWTGSEWWATLANSSDLVRMDTSFTELSSIGGPSTTNNGCHFLDGYLYVMTPNGLYRRTV